MKLTIKTFASLSLLFISQSGYSAQLAEVTMPTNPSSVEWIYPTQTGDLTINCSDATWVGTPGMESGNFVAVREGKCVIQLPQEGQLPKLDQFLLSEIAASKTIHAGPIEETYRELPSVRFDVTVEQSDGGSNSVTVRQDAHIATDLKERLMYETLSKSVAGSGQAGYLRKLDTFIEVTRLGTPGSFELKLNTLIKIDKPWYAPTGTFVNQAKQMVIELFQKSRAQLAKDFAKNL